MGLRGWLYRKLFGSKAEKKELYVKAPTPREYKKLVNKAISLELAEKTKEVMQLRKELEERDKFIKSLLKKIEKIEDREVKEQKKILKRLKRSNEFVIYVKPERPVTVISSFNTQPFVDQYGEQRPYLVGIKICNSPYGPYVVPLLSRKPNDTDDIASLETSPPIYLSQMFEMFSDHKLLVHKLKHGGILEVNVSPEGYFIPSKIPYTFTEVEPPEEPEKRDKGDDKHEKKKK